MPVSVILSGVTPSHHTTRVGHAVKSVGILQPFNETIL